jgi:hypothetical protein
MERVISRKEKVRSSTGRDSRCRRSWLDYGLVFLAYCLLVGCTTLKKAGVVGLAAGAGATAGTVLSGGVAAPILGATTTAFVADAVTEATSIGSGNMSECVTGFWPLLGQVIETGGWLIAGVILVPLIMGFLIPNGLERKRKRRT